MTVDINNNPALSWAEEAIMPPPACPSYRERQGDHDDAVHHPSHYASGKYEVIDIIEDQLGLDGLRGFCLGNTIKYVCRAGKKDPAKTIEDLEKAEWYLHHCIERMKERKAEHE